MGNDQTLISIGLLKKLTKVNSFEALVVVLILGATTYNSYKTWFSLPEKVAAQEAAAGAFRQEIRNEIANVRSEAKIITDQARENRELLIRMDERLKALQRKFNIPTDP